MAPRVGNWHSEALAFAAEGLSSREAGERWGITRNAAHERMARAAARVAAQRAGAPTIRDVMSRLATIEKIMRSNDDVDARVAKRQLEECRRELGPLVDQLGASDVNSSQLQQLHAALRVVKLDAESLVAVVKARLRRR